MNTRTAEQLAKRVENALNIKPLQEENNIKKTLRKNAKESLKELESRAKQLIEERERFRIHVEEIIEPRLKENSEKTKEDNDRLKERNEELKKALEGEANRRIELETKLNEIEEILQGKIQFEDTLRTEISVLQELLNKEREKAPSERINEFRNLEKTVEFLLQYCDNVEGSGGLASTSTIREILK